MTVTPFFPNIICLCYSQAFKACTNLCLLNKTQKELLSHQCCHCLHLKVTFKAITEPHSGRGLISLPFGSSEHPLLSGLILRIRLIRRA